MRQTRPPGRAVDAEQPALPLVSVVVVNFRGAQDTITCLKALRSDLDYPADLLQLVCVDNGSGDDSAERIRAAVDGVELVQSPTNLGFAGGCNLGAQHARGQVLAFLNNDARPHREWVSAAVEVLLADPTVGAVASQVLDWDGQRIDFVDAAVTWYGMGHKPLVTQPAGTAPDEPRDVLFGTGAAMFVRASLYRALGGFDERFFMFFEDVDLGWRLNLRGWRVRYQPRSLAYHRHHASMSTVDNSRELFLLERNALAMLYKNLEDATLGAVLPAALTLGAVRARLRGGLDTGLLGMDRRPASGPDESGDVAVPRAALAGLLAVDGFAELLPALVKSRRVEQAARVRSDADLRAMMGPISMSVLGDPAHAVAISVLEQAFDIEGTLGRTQRVVVITEDSISARMAGPAIRAWNIAGALAREHEVRLVTLSRNSEPVEAPFAVLKLVPAQLADQVAWADIVVFQGHVLEKFPALVDSTTVVVCDIYDPMHLEQLEQTKDLDDALRAATVSGTTKVLSKQLARGDFFLCASERQRHLWLGHLSAIGRVTPQLYDADPSLRSLLDVAPFGLPAKPPQRTGTAIKDVVPGIGESDKVVLWAGGIYNWFDPLTLVQAVDRLRTRRADLRLFFLGMRHPNPDVPEMSMAVRARQLADRLGLTGQHVFFNERWVAYSDRQNYLLDADCGVTTHFEHVETTFAFRTRVLDYLWAGLPIVTTDGDSFAELIRAERLGVVVPAEDPAALADALERVLYDPEFAAGCRERIAAVRDRYTWEQALEPLVRFCRNPRPAADRLVAQAALATARPLSAQQRVRRDLALVREYLTAGGPTEVAKRATGRLRRLAKDRFGNG